MLSQSTVRFNNTKFTYYDLSGFGKEGKIEGLEYKELVDVILDVSNELTRHDLEFVITALGQELLKREK